MSHILMCKGTDCPDKMYCYRYMAVKEIKDIEQEYLVDVPYNKVDGWCNSFWRLRLGDEIRDEG